MSEHVAANSRACPMFCTEDPSYSFLISTLSPGPASWFISTEAYQKSSASVLRMQVNSEKSKFARIFRLMLGQHKIEIFD